MSTTATTPADPNTPLPLETPRDFLERSGLGQDRAWVAWTHFKGHISRAAFRRAVRDRTDL